MTRRVVRTAGTPRTRSAADRIACGTVTPGPAAAPSARQLLEQPRLELLRVDATRRRDETAHLPASDEPPPAELDALELAVPRPRPDRRRPEPHVRRVEDLGRLGERDPIRGRARHRSVPRWARGCGLRGPAVLRRAAVLACGAVPARAAVLARGGVLAAGVR